MVKKETAKSNLPVTEKTKIAHDYLKRCLDKIKNLKITYDGIDLHIDKLTVSKWYTLDWGEIPADFNKK